MKKVFFVLAALMMTAGIVYAQDAVPQQKKDQKRDRIQQEDHLMCEGGQFYQYRNGERTQLKEQIRLKDGTVCNPDGTCQLKNQQQFRIRDGACVDLNGNMYKNQKRFNKGKMEPYGTTKRVTSSSMKQSGQMGAPNHAGQQRKGARK